MAPKPIVPNPRQAALLQAVHEQGSATVDALAQRFQVTLQTVRRDVGLLASAGLLSRFHGNDLHRHVRRWSTSALLLLFATAS